MLCTVYRVYRVYVVLSLSFLTHGCRLDRCCHPHKHIPWCHCCGVTTPPQPTDAEITEAVTACGRDYRAIARRLDLASAAAAKQLFLRHRKRLDLDALAQEAEGAAGEHRDTDSLPVKPVCGCVVVVCDGVVVVVWCVMVCGCVRV